MVQGGAYRVEVAQEGHERVWRVVSPDGNPMYSYADGPTAQAEAAVLNELQSSPDSSRLRLQELSHAAMTGRLHHMPGAG
jgi:hypothetical protein